MKDDLKQELDFELESRHGEKCAADLRDLKFVHIPNINWKYTTKVRNVLQQVSCLPPPTPNVGNENKFKVFPIS